MRGLVSSGLIVLMAATACSSQADPQPPPSVSQSATPQAPTTPPTVNQARVIATGLKSPWGLAFLPDGSALVTLRDSGLIERVVPSATASAQVTTVGQVPGVNHQAGGENGLLGIAVEPGPDPKAMPSSPFSASPSNPGLTRRPRTSTTRPPRRTASRQ